MNSNNIYSTFKMPENRMKQQKPRPTSDIIMEAGRKLISEVERSTVADSNKHVSILLARSRSLDVLSTSSVSSSSSSSPDKLTVETISANNEKTILTYSPSEERDCEQLDLYVANTSLSTAPGMKLNSADSSSISTDNASVKDDSSSIVSTPAKKDATLLKEKSELNNNENYNNSSRSSSISTSSSNYSDCSRSHSGSGKSSSKMQRRSNEGGALFQEVVLSKNEPIRITGYLEKRSKVLGWKKFWFVLDGRLLTYYKSKADYESLSACCGCINLGIASTVRPIQIRGCKGYPLQIATRSQVYYLRSQEKPVLEQWLIAIQEAASSPPSSSLLTSWNSCSGSQYFKYPFSQSQWSLNNSTDDITDISERLGNLPDTFYERRNRGSLAIPSPTLSQAPPVIQKYHSFQSLQLPVINNYGKDSSPGSRRVVVSSTENLRDLRDIKADTSPRMQHSTSLLVLDSSPQAAELRKELTRKLSIGSSKNGSSTGGEDAVPTPKFLLLSAKKKLALQDDDSHHYAEINEYVNTAGEGKRHYENCDVEKLESITSAQLESKRNSRGESAERDSNIYEHIGTVDPMSISSIGTPVWEPLNDGNNVGNLNKRFPPHRLSAGSNRNSLVSISELPEDSSLSPTPVKTPVLTSIPEASWRTGVEPYKSFNKVHSEDDLSSCRSESFRSLPCVEKGSKKGRKKAIGGFFAKVFGKNKGKGGKSSSQENLHKSMIISGPVDLRKQTQMQEKKHFQETPERRPLKSNKVADNNNASELSKSSSNIPGSRMTINNTIVMDELKQKVGHITLKRTNSRSNSGSESDSPPKEITIQPRVPYIPRTLSNASSHEKQTPVLVFHAEDKLNETNTDDDILTPVEEYKRIQETQTASICISPENETSCSEAGTIPRADSQKEDNLKIQNGTAKTDTVDAVKGSPPESDIPWRKDSIGPTGLPYEIEADFQNKLAKFNRLSQRLSASFIAAMNPPHQPMGRTRSYKAGKIKEEIIPPLPPKKKNLPISASTGTISLYDVPSNNKPVVNGRKISSKINVNNNEQSIAEYVRNLTKKNSTPDIVLSANNPNPLAILMANGKDFRKVLNSTSSTEDNFDVHKSNPALPPAPGRPPKPKPPVKPKSLEMGLNRIKRNSESSSGSGSSTEVISESSTVTPITPVLPSPCILQIPHASPATSSKSLDIDTLNALSDAGLSDTKASNSPPDSPKVCPVYPNSAKQGFKGNFLVPCNVNTPDSIASISDRIVPDSLATTPDAEIILSSPAKHFRESKMEKEPLSINKLEIMISDNDGSPFLKSPDFQTESRMDSLERTNTSKVSDAGISTLSIDGSNVYQNLKFATVNTLIQEFETVEENEEEISELYDDFPAEFYTPTPSSFSGYSPSDISSASIESPVTATGLVKKHARIDNIRNTGMEQLEAYLSLGSNSSSDELTSFESCVDSLSEDGNSKLPGTPAPTSMGAVSINNSNDTGSNTLPLNDVPVHNGSQLHNLTAGVGANRTGAISRLGHSSAIGHLQKILTNDVKL